MKSLAPDFNVVYRSADPQKLFCFSPAIIVRPNGRYIASLDLSDKYGKILVSDDKGETWRIVAEEPFLHASLFADGDIVYLLGCCRVGENCDLVVMSSDDNGETWGEECFLTRSEKWHHCAIDAHYKDGYVYLAMEKIIKNKGEKVKSKWFPNIMAPVVLRGRLGTDLTKRENWLFSKEIRYKDIVNENDIDYIGVPFFDSVEGEGKNLCSAEEYRRSYDVKNDRPGIPFVIDASGWLETNVVQITDPKHYWYDPDGKTLHLFMRANLHRTGYCALMKAVERMCDGKESIDIECETTPSGKRIVFLPMPGGQNKFYVKYDDETKLYWLLSVQTRDSMTRIEFLSEERFGIPSDERERLALHFSKNMVDWCFAGIVDKGDSPKQARHYASMDFDGDDLIVVSRSGDEHTASAHDTNMITFHRIKDFRNLVY